MLFRNFIFLYVIIIVSFFCFSNPTFEIIKPNYFDIDGNEKIIYYLQDEPLTFKFCQKKEINEITAKIKCLSQTKQIELIGDENCYYSNLDFNKNLCDDFSLEFDYNDGKNIEKKFLFENRKISKTHDILFSQEVESLDAVQISYLILANSKKENLQTDFSKKLYEQLKKLRNNEKKCWPSDICNNYKTSKILKNLKLSGYGTATKILEDGKSYFKKNIFDNVDIKLKYTIFIENSENITEDILCNFEIDGEITKISFNRNEDEKSVRVAKKLDINCDRKIERFSILKYNLEDKFKELVEYENLSKLSIDVPQFLCFGKSSCNFDVTLNLLIAFKDLENKKLFENYIDDFLKKDSVNEKQSYINFEPIILKTSNYLIYKKNDEIINYLRYKQNNDGSWGDLDEKATTTSKILFALKENSNSEEYVEDGISYLLENEQDYGWGGIEENSLAFIALNYIPKPYLKFETINILENAKEILFQNLGGFELESFEVVLENKIEEFVDVKQNKISVNPEEKILITLNVSNKLKQKKFGKVDILSNINGEKKLIKTFVLEIKGGNILTFNEDKFFQVQNQKDFQIPLIADLNGKIDCEYNDPISGKKEKIEITKNTKNLEILNEKNFLGKISFDILCKNSEDKFKYKISGEVKTIEPTFKFSLEELILNGEETSFKIESNIFEKQNLFFEIEGKISRYVRASEKEKIIAGKDVRDIYLITRQSLVLVEKKIYEKRNNVTITYEEFLKNITGNLKVTTDKGHSLKLPLTLQLSQDETENEESFGIFAWSSIFFLIFFVGFILFRCIQYIILKKKEENKEEEDEEDEEFFFEGENKS